MPHRRSVRLPGHDYAGGLYLPSVSCFARVLTICTHDRQPHLGAVVDGVLHLSPLGRIAEAAWVRTGAIRAEVVLDAFVVMPNPVG